MIEITNVRHGAILNHNHGIETDKMLKFKLQGVSEGGYPVKINGEPALMDGRLFSREIVLTEKINHLLASVMTPYGKFTQELVLVWDKKSFHRFNFYIDDHSFVFTDLAQKRPTHAFDHFYLAGLKKIHDHYGMKVTLNVFYHNDHHDFELKDMPGIWKPEFTDNSDWLKFSFHSYGEFPDRPYLEATAEEFSLHYDLVKNEIFRFAGEQSFIPPVVIHWGNIHPNVALELARRGTKCYSTAFRPRVMGGPSLADRQHGGNMSQIEKHSISGEDKSCGMDGIRMHYEIPEESSYLNNHRSYYDPSIDMIFFGSSYCCNLVPLEEIPKLYAALFENAREFGFETFGGASHEQYTFPYYANYIPDHLKRIETSVRCMVEDGCKPVFFNDGILGNTAWEK